MFSRLKLAKATASNVRDVHKRGGPKRVRLRGVEEPEGKIFTTSTAHLEVKTRDGGTVKLEPQLPVPFVYAWSYRLAKKLGVPLIADLEPKKLEAGLPVPSWAWPGSGR